MFCHVCGTPAQPDQRFCAGCGRPAVDQRPVRTAPPPSNRVLQHIRSLGIVWIVASALRILPVMGMHWFWPFRSALGWPFWGACPGFLMGIFGAFTGLLAVTGFLGLAAGIGLLHWQGWARTLAIVLGCIALIHMPFGTALGIYTLWVLAPAESAAEFRRVAAA